MSTADINSVIDQLSNATVDESAVLSFAGRGFKLDSEADAADIVEAVHSHKCLEVLELKGNTLGVDAAKSIGAALEQHQHFKRALWSDLFTGRLKTEIPDALKHLCGGLMRANANLVELDLSDNAFGPNGMLGLTDFLRSPSCYSLRELRLNNNGLGIQGGKMLAESLMACYKSSVSAGQPIALRVFVSGRGRLENEGATALAEAFKAMKSLEEVHMPQNGINHEGITALADAFAVNTSLRHINLSDNTFTEKGTVSMAKALPHLNDLQVINFDDCLIRTKGATALAKALTNGNDKLKTLKLSGNEISQRGAEAIAKAAAKKSQLEELDLNCNQLGSDGVASVRNLLKSAKKADILQSLSDDEGTEDEDEPTEDEEVEPENDEDGEEIVDSGLEICGEAITIHPPPPPQTSAHDFLKSPSLATFQQLGASRDKLLADYLEGDFSDVEKVVSVFMKVLQVGSQCDEQTKAAVCLCADAVLSNAFKQEKLTTSALCNTLLVHLGLIKSEDKSFRAPAVTAGSLLVLQHSVQQSYFPQSAKQTLAFCIDKSKDKTAGNADAWKQLVEVLNCTRTED